MKAIKDLVKKVDDLRVSDFEIHPAWIWDEDLGENDNFDFVKVLNQEEWPNILKKVGVFCKARFITHSAQEILGFISLDRGKCHFAALEIVPNKFVGISQMKPFWHRDSFHNRKIEMAFEQSFDKIFPIDAQVYIPDFGIYKLKILNLTEDS